MSRDDYRFMLDDVLITYVLNYLSCVKGYLNRKIKRIDKNVEAENKNAILSIVSTFWHRTRKQTALDTVVEIRNKFEHEKIDGIRLEITINKDKIIKRLMYENYNLIQLFVDAYRELKILDQKIKEFVEKKISDCNLRECALFKIRFSERFKTGYRLVLEPEPTEEEISKMDEYIDDLVRQG